MSDTPKEPTGPVSTVAPTISVAHVYQYKPAGKYEQASKDLRPNPKQYNFLPPETAGSAPPQEYRTVARERFLDEIINQYNVVKNFGEGSLRDGKPCLIKAFEKLSFAEFDAIRESIKNQKGETDPLVKHLENLDKKNFKASTFNPSEVQSMVAILKDHALLPKIQQKRSVTLTELLGGKEKLKVFKEALAEEVNSPEFLKALWEHSLKPHYGKKDPNIFAIQIMSGASGSGKSFAGEQAVDREYPLANPETSPDLTQPTFWMAWVDGGIARDINVTQQYVKMLSLELGVEVDLSEDSKKILDGTKKRVKKAIIETAKGTQEVEGLDRMKIGIVEPLTYSSDIVRGDVKKEIQTVRKLAQALPPGKQVQLSYDYVSGNDFEEHAKVVETQGVNRAFPTTGQAQSEFEKINPEVKVGAEASPPQTRLERFMRLITNIRFAENKKYGPGGYQYGVNGSVHGFIEYEKAFRDPKSRVELSRHINCNDLRVFTIDGELWDAKKHSGQERHVFSERLVADWKASKEGTLIDYASKNRSNPKYSNFMTNFNPKDLKFGLSSEVEKIFQSNFQKKARLVSVSPNNLGYLVPFLNILDRLHQTKGEKEAYNDPEQIKGLIAELSQLIAEKRKENLGKKLNPFVTSNTLPLMEKTLQKLIKREALLARKEILSLKAKIQEFELAGVQLSTIFDIAKLTGRLPPLVDKINTLEFDLDSTRANVEFQTSELQKKLVPEITTLQQQLAVIDNQLASPSSLKTKTGLKGFFGIKWTDEELNANKSTIQARLTLLQNQLKAPAEILAIKETTLQEQQEQLKQLQKQIKEKKELLQLTTSLKSLSLGEGKSFLQAPLDLSQAITGYIEQLQSRKESFSDKASETANSETILGSDGSTAAETLSETSSRVSIEDVSERDEVKSTISSVAETAPETLSVSDSELVSGIFGDSLEGLLINPKDSSKVHYPFSQKLYDLSLARIQGNDHKNAEYLIALNQIISSINPDDKVSIQQGIALLNQLEEIKSENKKGLSSGRSNTSQLIDEVKSYFETRLEVVKTFDVQGDFDEEIKKIDEELDEQLKPEPVKGWFVAWAEKVIESFIGWLATKKDMSQADVKSALTNLKEGLTIGWMFHVLINFITYAFSSKLLDSPQNQTEKLRASLLEKNQGSLQVDNTEEEEENRKSLGPQSTL
jgi:hypothetical protein